jgi:SAM-dependent methyltransferase
MENTIIDRVKKMYTFNSFNVFNKTDFPHSVGPVGYGETGFDSIEAIINNFKDKFNDDTIFYDLGSGFGKIVYHIGLLHNVKKSCGIEYSKERHEIALSFNKKYDLPVAENIILINGNILDYDISDATVIYFDNTLFPQSINDSIYKMIPKGCLVISRQQFKDSRINGELIRHYFDCFTEYGTDSLYLFIKS